MRVTNTNNVPEKFDAARLSVGIYFAEISTPTSRKFNGLGFFLVAMTQMNNKGKKFSRAENSRDYRINVVTENGHDRTYDVVMLAAEAVCHHFLFGLFPAGRQLVYDLYGQL